MKDAAFVKMRDSVSFYKIDPDEYVLRKSGRRAGALYTFRGWSVRRKHTREIGRKKRESCILGNAQMLVV
jgi:hypothetical protein